MRRWIIGLALVLAGTVGTVAAAPAEPAAPCVGRNLFDQMPASRRAEIAAASAQVPYATGTLYEATRGDARLLLVGTYHFTDPRHAATVDLIAPRIRTADRLLVEAGPDEEKQLQARLADEPTLMADPTGPTLPQRLDPEDWSDLSRALAERGVPAVIASRLRPWYVATMLGVSPCVLRELRDQGGADAGLDKLLIHAAQGSGVPVQALEPYDTVFTLFQNMTPAEEIDMILAALPAAAHADDYTTTTAEMFAQGRVWDLWEFGRFDAYDNSGLDRAEVDRQVALTQEQLMDSRNRNWIKPLTRAAMAAATRGKEVVAAFGALHLPGENGVLRLLERDGWTIRKVTT